MFWNVVLNAEIPARRRFESLSRELLELVKDLVMVEIILVQIISKFIYESPKTILKHK